MEAEPTVTVAEMAAMHDVTERTIRRYLLADRELPADERRIPGAVKVGSKYRGEWRIPLRSARAWQRGRAGRPKST